MKNTSEKKRQDVKKKNKSGDSVKMMNEMRKKTHNLTIALLATQKKFSESEVLAD